MSKFLSEYVYDIKILSSDDIEQIRLLLIDYFAAMFAGYKQNKQFSDCVENVVLSQGGKAEASVILSDKKVPAGQAAFLNSLYGHGAELDDGNKKAMGHVGVHVIPAVLSLAEAEYKSEKDILLAIVAGYEIFIRISSAAQPGMVNRSFHSTGMAGAPACAVACAKLLGLNALEIESAMSLACTMSSGLLTYSESQQMIKPLNPAKAAETGVFAARLAAAGIKGPLNCLEGVNGWFHAVTDEVNEKMLYGRANDKLLIHECYIKLYPSCRHTHCGIEASINLHNRLNLTEVKKINIFIYPNAIKLAGIKFPKNADETKFSIQYTLACGLIFGEYTVDYMNPPRMGQDIVDIIEKSELIPDSTLENREKGIRGTRIEIILKSGSVVEETVLVPKGDPERPLNKLDVINKFNRCVNGLLVKDKQKQIISYIENFGGDTRYDATRLFGN